MAFGIIILAAGKGRRMQSSMPKVLHNIGGRPMLHHVVNTAKSLDPARIIVVHGHGGDLVKESMADEPITWVEQAKQLGTGDAVRCALPHIADLDQVLILLGDVPLISNETLSRLIRHTPQESIGILTAKTKTPTGLGRIVRNPHRDITRIVEEKDADDTEKQINEINTGIFFLPQHFLSSWLPQLNNQNAQQEYYLTDLIKMACESSVPIVSTAPDSFEEVQGINDRHQLAALERAYQRRQAAYWLSQGVSISDPSRFDVRGEVSIAPGVFIDINVVLEGRVQIAANTMIGPNCVLKNCTIARDTVIDAFSHIDGAVVGESCQVGPYARLRPGTQMQRFSKVGNFVELKKTTLGPGAKANHLAYVGDATVGCDVNIGAGTITCNYDGVNKHQTVIEDEAFIGSNTALIAPVTVGRKATIGAGTVLRKSAPGDKLTLSRAPQKTLDSWQRPKKKEPQADKLDTKIEKQG